jgi:hypothetical protein
MLWTRPNRRRRGQGHHAQRRQRGLGDTPQHAAVIQPPDLDALVYARASGRRPPNAGGV